MILPKVRPIRNEYISQTFNPGMGENQYGTPFTINESESVKSRNLSSRAFPAMQTRPGRAKPFTDITIPNGIWARDNSALHIRNGGGWVRWSGSEWLGIGYFAEGGRTKFIDFTTGTTKYTIMSDGTRRYSWDGTSLVELTNFPLTMIMTPHKGRVYAMVGRELKFSALNEINDWTTVNDAGSITITNANTDGVAIKGYADKLVVLTASSMHELHGTGPFNFSLVDISEDGCIAERTLIESKGALYWLDEGEFKKYQGGTPVTISQKVQAYLKGIPAAYKSKCCCGKLGKYLYLSIPYGSTATECNLLLEYDTELEQWYPQTGSFVDFVTMGEKLYGLDATGKVWDMDSGTDDAGTPIQWYKESGAYIKQSLRQKKNLQNIYVLFDQPTGTELNVSTSATVDADDFVLRKTFSASANEQNQKVVLDANTLGNQDYYRLKLSGKGPVTVHAIEQYYRMEK